MQFDLDRVRENIKSATTEDLLDRATVYRDGLEPQARVLVEWELEQRGISLEAIETHRRLREEVLRDSAGYPLTCSFCNRPAVRLGWGWHRMWGKIPLFPRRFRYCAECSTDAPPTPPDAPPNE
jgi:hypothetical protein